jgi:co-chaperonin GroES (HSP10)
MTTPRLEPLGDNIVGRLVDMTKTAGGLTMPDTQTRGVTAFALVDAIGPDVKSCKVGDIVVPGTMGHVFMRGGAFHRMTFKDKDVLCIVHDLDPETISIQGEGNGTTSSRLIMPPAGM